MNALDPLRTSTVALLTSYRRDGRRVGTPVGMTIRDGYAYFTTRSKTWKVKRIANNPRVTFAPCTRRGNVTGATVEGSARPIRAEEATQLRGGVRHRVWVLIYRIVYRDRPISYEFTPDEAGT